MADDAELIRRRLRTPRAAALAGILFGVLLMSSQLLIWLSIPSKPLTPASEAIRDFRTVEPPLDPLPFAGIAFLWFMAVAHDRIGDFEDRFFATVFLSSALLHVAMMFIGAVITGAVIALLAGASDSVATAAAYLPGRAELDRITASPVFGTMAGVSMISTSAILVRTTVVPRRLAITGYAFALALLLRVGRLYWIAAIFPLWVLLIRNCILVQNRQSWTARQEFSAVARI